MVIHTTYGGIQLSFLESLSFLPKGVTVVWFCNMGISVCKNYIFPWSLLFMVLLFQESRIYAVAKSGMRLSEVAMVNDTSSCCKF